jgi:ABC-type Na+ efflux pump permease subunit
MRKIRMNLWRRERRVSLVTGWLALLIVFASLFGGCRSAQETSYPTTAAQEMPAAASVESGGYSGLEPRRSAMMDSRAKSKAAVNEVAGPRQAQTAGPALQPQLIKEANVTMKVDRVSEAGTRVKQLVRNLGGYITMENTTLSDEAGSYRSATLTIRLPQGNLDRFLDAAGNVGKILSESISATDVSKELVDTEARIRNLQAEEKALQQIMNRAGKIPEVLEVSRELARVRGEIEQAQGNLNYMRSQVAYSTVNLSLSENMVTPAVNAKPGIGTVISNTAQEAWSALYGFLLGLVSLAIWLIFFLPVIGLILYGIGWVIRWMVVRAHRTWKARRESAKAGDAVPEDI